MIRHGYDASKPPSKPYPGTQAAFGYLGGKTPHIWTLQEWLNATEQGRDRCLGIWVADFSLSPGPQAIAAAKQAISLGWSPDAAPRRAIALDSETSLNVTFIHDFHDSLLHQGFVCLDYRSLDAILQAPSGLPEWVAHYGVPPGPFTTEQVAYQYIKDLPWDDTTVDLSAFDDTLWNVLGRGPRRHVIDHNVTYTGEYDPTHMGEAVGDVLPEPNFYPSDYPPAAEPQPEPAMELTHDYPPAAEPQPEPAMELTHD